MRERANNESHRRFKVNDCVLIKCSNRQNGCDPHYNIKGMIIGVNGGTFEVQADDGTLRGPSVPLRPLLNICVIGNIIKVAANRLRHFNADVSLPEPIPSCDDEEEPLGDDDIDDELPSTQRETVHPSGNYVVVDNRFAKSKAPKNFNNQMRNLAPERRRGVKRFRE
jgi:hypothetical protein